MIFFCKEYFTHTRNTLKLYKWFDQSLSSFLLYLQFFSTIQISNLCFPLHAHTSKRNQELVNLTPYI